MFEFPGPATADEQKTESRPSKKIGVTYSSINGNGFGGYGEVVMGTKGTLVVLEEQDVMLFKDADDQDQRRRRQRREAARPTLDTTESGGADAAIGKLALETGPPSRGYTEEIEHWAWCIRNRDPQNLPKCHPKVALGDAVIALTTNIAIRDHSTARIEFKNEWFDIDSDETPEGIKPEVKI